MKRMMGRMGKERTSNIEYQMKRTAMEMFRLVRLVYRVHLVHYVH